MAQKRKKSIVRALFSGSVLTSRRFTYRLPILLFVGLLMLVYIAIGFNVQRKHSYVEVLESEIIELKTISVTTSAKREQLTRRSNIEKLLKKYKIELSEADEMPKVIQKR